jgi:hypothetical protein
VARARLGLAEHVWRRLYCHALNRIIPESGEAPVERAVSVKQSRFMHGHTTLNPLNDH